MSATRVWKNKIIIAGKEKKSVFNIINLVLFGLRADYIYTMISYMINIIKHGFCHI